MQNNPFWTTYNRTTLTAVVLWGNLIITSFTLNFKNKNSLSDADEHSTSLDNYLLVQIIMFKTKEQNVDFFHFESTQ
jgi:hypothetical protein